MITIDQLLESVDLDFEPRWVTKDYDGEICIHKNKPALFIKETQGRCWDFDEACPGLDDKCKNIGFIKLTEFDGKDWTECIYEVPRKEVISKMETTGEIEKIVVEPQERFEPVLKRVIETLNAVVDAVNEINENYACIAALTDIRKRLDTLEKCVKNKRSEE